MLSYRKSGKTFRIGVRSTATLLSLTLIVSPLSAQKESGSKKTDFDQKGKKESEQSKADARQKKLELLKSHIRYGSMKIRVQAIDRIPELKPEEQPDFVDILKMLAINDLDPAVRKQSVEVLGKVGDSSSDAVLEQALADKNFDVKEQAVRSLGKRDARQASKSLFELLKGEDFSTDDRFLIGLIDVLGRFQYTEAADFLQKKAEEKTVHIDTRRKILLYFGQAEASGASDFLLKTVQNELEDVTDRAYAVNSLGKIKYEPAVPVFQKILKEIQDLPPGREKTSLVPLKLQLIAALVRLGDRSVYPLIKAAALDESAGVRLRAVRQMGELKMKDQRELLEYKAKFDDNPRVRKEAQKALDLIDGKIEKNDTGEEEEEP